VTPKAGLPSTGPPRASYRPRAARLFLPPPEGGGGQRPEGGGWAGCGCGMQEQGRKVGAIRGARRYVTGFHRPQAARSESPDEAAQPLRSGVHAGREAGARSLPTREHKGVEAPYPFGLYRMSIKVLPQATGHGPVCLLDGSAPTWYYAPQTTGHELTLCLPLGGGGRRPEGGCRRERRVPG